MNESAIEQGEGWVENCNCSNSISHSQQIALPLTWTIEDPPQQLLHNQINLSVSVQLSSVQWGARQLPQNKHTGVNWHRMERNNAHTHKPTDTQTDRQKHCWSKEGVKRELGQCCYSIRKAVCTFGNLYQINWRRLLPSAHTHTQLLLKWEVMLGQLIWFVLERISTLTCCALYTRVHSSFFFSSFHSFSARPLLVLQW